MPFRLRLGYLLLAGGALLAGLVGALLRAGVAVPVGHAAEALLRLHPVLMLLGFLGTLIGLERSVALPARVAYGVPALLWAGMFWPLAGVAGALLYGGLVAYHGHRMSPGLHVWMMALGGVFLAGAYAAPLAGGGPDLKLFGMLFLMFTIFGERLELGRIIHHQRMLRFSAVALAVGLMGTAWCGSSGLSVGALLLALWLLYFDTARRIIRWGGLSRYIAVNLLTGYLWLALYGLSPWLPMPQDMQIHSFFLGFVFMMIFAHAPIIFPALMGFRLGFHRSFYLPMILMNVSLLLRWGGWLAVGGSLSVVAVLALPVVIRANVSR